MKSGFPRVFLLVTLVVITEQTSRSDDLSTKDTGSPVEFTLSPGQWQKVEGSVDRALEFLIRQQAEDGSFRAPDIGQPGVTSLCVLAFLSRGIVPDEGPYGGAMSRAIGFVLSRQRSDGLLFDMPIGGSFRHNTPAHTGIYNHAIAALMLTEVYGMGAPEQQERMRVSIIKARDFTLKFQSHYKRNPEEQGGWRYLKLATQQQRSDADLSVTAWQLLFLRSARNAGFEVPPKAVDAAMEFVEGCYDRDRGTFAYCIVSGRNITPAMCGAGVVSLSMGGRHDSELSRRAGQWMLQQQFDRYQGFGRYHYGAYYCSQAAFQLGAKYWSEFYPPLMNALVENQNRDGSWDQEQEDAIYGNAYTTALSVLALTPPYQLLPIYQR